jgi:succinoglycan biosynthesis protein ExoA
VPQARWAGIRLVPRPSYRWTCTRERFPRDAVGYQADVSTPSPTAAARAFGCVDPHAPGRPDGTTTPSVSVIIPSRNEVATIVPLLAALGTQTYAIDEIIVADGMSTDGTRAAVAAFQGKAPLPEVRMIDNPDRTVPAGLNRAVSESVGEIVIRLDAHARPAPDYVARCVTGLLDGKGANVGGLLDVAPAVPGVVARAIALAVSHPLGAGDAAYRVGGRAGAVDTVPFGAFRRETLAAIGPFNEELPVNQDFEYNARIRAAGGTVWFDPAIRCTYYARSNLIRLYTQYWRYGIGKRRMLRRHPRALRPRQVVPPMFVGSLAVAGALARWTPGARRFLAIVLGGYAAALGMGAGHLRARGGGPSAFLTPVVFATIHLAWGAGFLAESARSETSSSGMWDGGPR